MAGQEAYGSAAGLMRWVSIDDLHVLQDVVARGAHSWEAAAANGEFRRFVETKEYAVCTSIVFEPVNAWLCRRDAELVLAREAGAGVMGACMGLYACQRICPEFQVVELAWGLMRHLDGLSKDARRGVAEHVVGLCALGENSSGFMLDPEAVCVTCVVASELVASHPALADRLMEVGVVCMERNLNQQYPLPIFREYLRPALRLTALKEKLSARVKEAGRARPGVWGAAVEYLETLG